MQQRFFDIITPVFDGALSSLQKLSLELKAQSFTNWNWILCNNGSSACIQSFVTQQNDSRIIFLEFPHQDTNTIEKLLRNINERRSFCLNQTVSSYIIFLDADIKILEPDYLQILANGIARNSNSQLFLYNIFHSAAKSQLPTFPFQHGKIDLSNCCIERSLAVSVGFPCDASGLHKKNYQHKDYVFFIKLLDETARTVCYFDTKPLLDWNGNNEYSNLSKAITIYKLTPISAFIIRSKEKLKKIFGILKNLFFQKDVL